MLSTGCASLKYPNWETVSIEYSVDNKPCVKKGINEQCSSTKDDCNIWFKKRATLVKANTVEIHSNISDTKFVSKYFQCETGMPLYKKPKFNKEDYKSGSNTVTGQAFLRQNGGGIVTCAGKTVVLYPDTAYFSDIFDEEYGEFLLTDNELNQAKSVVKETQCDAQGSFEFYKIPAGKWVIKTNVSWDVYSVKSIGTYYYTADEKNNRSR